MSLGKDIEQMMRWVRMQPLDQDTHTVTLVLRKRELIALGMAVLTGAHALDKYPKLLGRRSPEAVAQRRVEVQKAIHALAEEMQRL